MKRTLKFSVWERVCKYLHSAWACSELRSDGQSFSFKTLNCIRWVTGCVISAMSLLCLPQIILLSGHLRGKIISLCCRYCFCLSFLSRMCSFRMDLLTWDRLELKCCERTSFRLRLVQWPLHSVNSVGWLHYKENKREKMTLTQSSVIP